MKRIFCFLIGHKYKHVKMYSFMSAWELVKCKRCHRKIILDHARHDSCEWDRYLDIEGDNSK